MSISRRRFVQTSAVAATAALASPIDAQRGRDNAPAGPLPDAIRALKPFPGKAAPITEQEHLGRIEKARTLLGYAPTFEPEAAVLDGIRWLIDHDRLKVANPLII